VIRLLTFVLCALGLAFAPLAANAAAFGPQSMAGCNMQQKMPAKAASHAKMDCCTSACQVTSAALLPQRDVTADQPTGGKEPHTSLAITKLDSVAPDGLDPPPRLHS
jgi:hypothetical protein